jgi:hypothetical protein
MKSTYCKGGFCDGGRGLDRLWAVHLLFSKHVACKKGRGDNGRSHSFVEPHHDVKLQDREKKLKDGSREVHKELEAQLELRKSCLQEI